MPSGTNAGRALFINTARSQGKPVPSISTVKTFQTTNANRALYISQLEKAGRPVPSISTVRTFQTGRAPPFRTALIAPHYQSRPVLISPPRHGILNAQSETIASAPAVPSVTGAISSIAVPPPSAFATTNAFDLLDRYMTFIVPDANSRILGFQNIHFNVFTALAYWQSSQAQAHWGSYTITPIFSRAGKMVAPWYAFKVSGILMGTGFPVYLYFWGEVPGVNTIVTRVQWWKLYVASGIRENIKNRFSGTSGQAFVPVASEHGVLTEKPFIP